MEPTDLQKVDPTLPEHHRSFSVAFYPAVSTLVYGTEKIAQSAGTRGRSGYALMVFMMAQLLATPIALFLLGYGFLALAIFVLSAVSYGIILPQIVRTDYAAYYRTFFPEIEDRPVEVIIDEDFARYISRGDEISYSWKNIVEIEETRDAIYFFRKSDALVVNKTGFAFDEEKNEFLAFARSCWNSARRHQLSGPTDL